MFYLREREYEKMGDALQTNIQLENWLPQTQLHGL